MHIQLTQEQVAEMRARPIECHLCREMIHGDVYSVMAQPWVHSETKPNDRMDVYFFCDPCTQKVSDALRAAGLPPKKSKGDGCPP